jgi:hypothetical protein
MHPYKNAVKHNLRDSLLIFSTIQGTPSKEFAKKHQRPPYLDNIIM